eukprot:4679585-Prymnesium_polylepis.1
MPSPGEPLDLEVRGPCPSLTPPAAQRLDPSPSLSLQVCRYLGAVSYDGTRWLDALSTTEQTACRAASREAAGRRR